MFGEAVKSLREAAGMSLRQLARAAHVDNGHLSRVEAGTRPPTPEQARALDVALDAGGCLAALCPPAPGPDPVAVSVRDTDRLARLLDDSSPGDAADALGIGTHALAVDYLRQPAEPMLHRALALRRTAAAALRRARRPAHLTDLTLRIGEASGVLAYAALDLGDPVAAMTHTQLTARAAEAAGATELRAWARGTQSLIARFAGDYDAARGFAEDGLAQACHARDSSRIRLLCGLAQCRANLGDAAGTHAALREADDAREVFGGRDGPGLFGFTEAKQRYYSGSSLIWLPGRADAELARAEAEQAIELWRAGDPDCRSADDEALAHVYAATASVQLGELDAAQVWLEPILGLPEEQRISWIRKRMGRVAGLLARPPFDRSPAAVELRERIAAYR